MNINYRGSTTGYLLASIAFEYKAISILKFGLFRANESNDMS